MRVSALGMVLFALLATSTCKSRTAPPPSRVAEQTALASPSHPLAGMWKDHCEDEFGLAIAPAGEGVYSISFCGPGGCFEPGTYRPNSKILGDPAYRILDDDTMEIQTKGDFVRYFRCKDARSPNPPLQPTGSAGG